MVARACAFSSLIGAGLTALINYSATGSLSWRVLATGGLLGAVCCAFCLGLVAAFATQLGRLGGGPRWFGFGLLFFLGGATGWIVAVQIAQRLLDVRFHGDSVGEWAIGATINGTIALILGLVITTIEVLLERLRDSLDALKRREIEAHDLELAADLQRRLLPPTEITGEGFTVAARLVPARTVAGDFYDVLRLPDGSILVTVADVVGKGMGASLIMASTKAVLPLLADGRTVTETAAALNDRLAADLGPREFVALAMLRLAPDSGEFELVNAGLPDPYIGTGDGLAPLPVPGPRLPLGVRTGTAYQALHGSLAPGQRIVLLTDGIPEAVAADGVPLGYDRFEALLAQGTGSLVPWLDGRIEALRDTLGDEIDDDWTLLALERG